MMKHWRLIYLTIPLTVAVFAAILLANEWRSARPAQGVGLVPEAVRYAAEAEAVKEEAAEYRLDSYTEGDGPAPEWWDPDEPMAAEWIADVTDINVGDINVPCNKLATNLQPNTVDYNTQRDVGCPDYNIETTIYGWDGHCMESWEMDLLLRIVYLEFNGVEAECMNAGIDSILNLWNSGYFGRTLFDTLSATAENGALVYTTYGYVWDWDYDYTVLEEIKAICLERFVNGPQYGCHFFQLYGFPWWAEPLYKIGTVYFSTFKEGTR